MRTIAAVVGSLRSDSYNRRLFEAFKKYTSSEISFVEVPIDFPLYNADVEAQGIPESVRASKKIIETADGILIITPEYNRSVPGVLKNAIDWMSRPDGESSWKGKRVATAGTTTGSLGTAPAQQHLRAMLVYLDTHIMGQPEFYLPFGPDKLAPDGTIEDEKTRARVEKFIAAFTNFLG